MTATPPDDSYPASWRPKGLPDDNAEALGLAVDSYVASLSPPEFKALVARTRGASE